MPGAGGAGQASTRAPTRPRHPTARPHVSLGHGQEAGSARVRTASKRLPRKLPFPSTRSKEFAPEFRTVEVFHHCPDPPPGLKCYRTWVSRLQRRHWHLDLSGNQERLGLGRPTSSLQGPGKLLSSPVLTPFSPAAQ